MKGNAPIEERPLLRVLDKWGDYRRVEQVRPMDRHDFDINRQVFDESYALANNPNQISSGGTMTVKLPVLDHIIECLDIELNERRFVHPLHKLEPLTLDWNAVPYRMFWDYTTAASYRGIKKDDSEGLERRYQAAVQRAKAKLREEAQKGEDNLLVKCNQLIERQLVRVNEKWLDLMSDMIRDLNVKDEFFVHEGGKARQLLLQGLDQIDDKINTLKAQRDDTRKRIAMLDRNKLVDYLLTQEEPFTATVQQQIQEIAKEYEEHIPKSRRGGHFLYD